jgi:hypothetical protein
MEYLLLSELRSRRSQCDRERGRHTTCKCPHAKFLGQNIVDGLVIQIQLTTNHCGCQMSIRIYESLHVGPFSSFFEM